MSFDPSKIPWRDPWEAVRPEHRELFEKELRKEVCQGHPLFGKAIVAVGRRQDCDDVLFYLGEALPQFALVHLTYAHEIVRTNQIWPTTKLFNSIEDWIHEGLNRDADDFENG